MTQQHARSYIGLSYVSTLYVCSTFQSSITVGTFASRNFLTYCLVLPRHALKYICTSPCLYSQLLCSLIHMDFVDSIHMFDDIALSQIKHVKIENLQARTRCEQAVYSELSLKRSYYNDFKNKSLNKNS